MPPWDHLEVNEVRDEDQRIFYLTTTTICTTGHCPKLKLISGLFVRCVCMCMWDAVVNGLFMRLHRCLFFSQEETTTRERAQRTIFSLIFFSFRSSSKRKVKHFLLAIVGSFWVYYTYVCMPPPMATHLYILKFALKKESTSHLHSVAAASQHNSGSRWV